MTTYESSAINEITTELAGISLTITGLSNQMDDECPLSLTKKSLQDALWAVCRHIDRIAKDLQIVEKGETEQ